ncbi:hypothetical protein K435DRAFT_656209 [Dendrothele bispora CBS 962.96]|uniref:Uncharacterized protein n=1 Tax=Dendrothele bispora (strain CBS 962.96) TaxID=1314807 RepID=A0A4S8MEJ2_DENBC|nr:hypothetical protein K435DRAFT_656209 [Dendrothele bispora CBS 962.96]
MPGWFIGSENIIKERGLWPENGLRYACEKTCFENETNLSCCCRKVLFYQPDFVVQKPAIQEFIEARGHLCDFYPKYHCELNFIEMYWGAGKLGYRKTPKTSNMADMRANVIDCLDNVPLLQIKRFSNRARRYIHAYIEGLDGPQAAWANRRYHGHRTLPPEMVRAAKEAIKSILE